MRRTARRVGTVAALSSLSGRKRSQAAAAQQAAVAQQAAQQAPVQQAAVPSVRAEATTGGADAVPQDLSGRLELLRQLGELHASGVLTDEEFAQQKRSLLS